MASASVLLVVGLGNPGPGYARNRHNVGFMAVDSIVRRHRFQPFRKRFHGDLSEGVIDGRTVRVLKPMTYMNDSGRAVVAAAGFYKIPPADILVFHDELDLAAGKVRCKSGAATPVTTACAASTPISVRRIGVSASVSVIRVTRTVWLGTCSRIFPRPTIPGWFRFWTPSPTGFRFWPPAMTPRS